jgi:predicted dinucleotide-binding enzyme
MASASPPLSRRRRAIRIVRRLAEDIGFEGVDAGPLQSARYLEPMGMLMIALAYRLGMGNNMGLRLIREG